MFAESDAVTILMGLLGIAGGATMILLELRAPQDEEEPAGLRLFRFRVNRWLAGGAGIAVGVFLLVHGPI